MKKASSFIILLAVVGLGMVPVMANAQNGAVVIKDTACTVLDLDSKTTFEVLNTVKVSTPSRNNNRNVSCHGDLSDRPENLPPEFPPLQAVTFDFEDTGFKCCVNFDGVWVSTDKWHEVITPSGNISLTCHFKDNETPAQDPDCYGAGPQ
jgi:hypothetical protein